MSVLNIRGEKSIMTEQLPISIGLSIELIEKFSKIKSLSNKLEAQFNFQTLTAGWYGDEENIIAIELVLQTPEDFAFQQQQKLQGRYHQFADDVFSYHNQDENQLTCYIAITASELVLLEQQARLLPGYIQAKIHKVLTLIGAKLQLGSI